MKALVLAGIRKTDIVELRHFGRSFSMASSITQMFRNQGTPTMSW
jgi:hypothetical protein